MDMTATKSSLGPEDEMRDPENLETKFWDASFAWGGSTLAEPFSPLCSSCQSLLVQPARDPNIQKGTLTEARYIIRQSVARTLNAAMGGCIVCKLVTAAVGTISQHTTSVNQLGGFKLALYWFGEKSNRFDRIDVVPFGSAGRDLSWHGFLDGIKLVLEDGESRTTPCFRKLAKLIVYIEQVDKAIEYPSPSSTGSQLCWKIAMRWLGTCITHHPQCREPRSVTDWLPTRLIDVGVAGDSQEPRLLLTSELKNRNNIGYTTLSHRWASARVAKLESSNIDLFRRRIPLESLSSAFLDAIRATRALGFRYLWIDSLCIVQDSAIDWQAELAEMGRVYRNCVCNLAATGGSDNGSGLFQERDPHRVTPSRVRIQYEGHDKIYLASLYEPWGKWISRSTLSRRGWVLQERMLSPRTLHFASQLFWECRMLQACETYPEGMPGAETSYTELDGSELPMSFKNWREECSSTEFWNNVVESFGRCSVTEPRDRLFAIAGVAKSLQPLLHDEYLAGLWKGDIPYNLGWYLANVKGELQASDGDRCMLRGLNSEFANKLAGPSWSWASIDHSGALICDLLVYAGCRVKALVNVVDARTKPLGSDEFGPLQGGYLVLAGRIGRIFSLTDESREGEWVNGHWSFEVHLDYFRDPIGDESLRCLPLLVRTLNPGEYPRIVDCLLLRPRPGSSEYKRVGLLKVSLELEDLLPGEIGWVVDHANSELCPGDLAEITIS